MSLTSNFLKFIKQNSKICLFISLCIVCFISLKIYHHTQPLPAKKWISSNLENIQVKDPTHFSFAVFGGNKVGRHAFEGTLKQVDHDPDIAFTVDLGDAVLKGRKPHYHHFIKQIDNNLGIPLLTVMGDNELSGEGRTLYKKIFGPLYYSFNIGKNYFFVIDNAGNRGPDQTQMQWLEKELWKSVDYETRIIFMHRPFYDPAEYNYNQFMPEELSVKLIDLFLKYHVSHIFASGSNVFYEGGLKGIPYTITGDAGTASFHRRDMQFNFFHFLKVTVEKDKVDVEIKKVFLPGIDRMSHVKYRTMVYADNMIRFHWVELSLIAVIMLVCIIYVIRKRRTGKRNED